MTNSVYATVSRQIALTQELSSIANNIANADTSGFRRDEFIFTEYVNALRGEPSLSQTQIGARAISRAQGEMIETGASLDVAIGGGGFFSVETPRGPRLTRAGSFTLNEQGVLTTLSGDIVSGEGGGPIAIPAATRSITIAADGSIAADGEQVGRFEIVDADVITLEREGADLFRATTGTVAISDFKLRQGFLESANVNPVLEMSRMIELQRAFEVGQQLLSEEFQRSSTAIDAFGAGTR